MNAFYFSGFRNPSERPLQQLSRHHGVAQTLACAVSEQAINQCEGEKWQDITRSGQLSPALCHALKRPLQNAAA